MASVQHFTTKDRPAGGIDLFQDQMSRLFSVGLAIRSPEEEPFHTQVTAYCGRNLRFAALRFSPHSTYSANTNQSNPRLLVTLQKEGVAVVEQDGRESRIEAGDMFMIDPSRPFCIQTGEILTHSIYLEREAIRSILPEVENLTAQAISNTEGPGALFRGMVDEMFGLVDMLQEKTADKIADALPYVLTAALTSLDSSAAMSPSRIKLLHKQRIMRFAKENLSNHELDAAMIARSVNLSTRYVYELFESDDQPPMKWIWQQRLDRCHADLASPALVARSIGHIAYRWGFNDLAHFSRAFRQRFGYAPRELRAKLRKSGNADSASTQD